MTIREAKFNEKSGFIDDKDNDAVVIPIFLCFNLFIGKTVIHPSALFIRYPAGCDAVYLHLLRLKLIDDEIEILIAQLYGRKFAEIRTAVGENDFIIRIRGLSEFNFDFS